MKRMATAAGILLAGAVFAQQPGGAGKDLGLNVARGAVYEESRQGDLTADLSLQVGGESIRIKARAKWERSALVDLQQVNAVPRVEVWKARRLLKKDTTTWTIEGRPDAVEENPLAGRAFSITKKGEGVFERAGEGCELDPSALADEAIPFLLESALAPEKPMGLNQPWTPSGLAMFEWLKEHGVLASTLSGSCSATSERPAPGVPQGSDTCLSLDLQAKGKEFSRTLVRGPMDATIRVKGTLVRSTADGCFSDFNLTIESTIAGDGKLPDGQGYHLEGKVTWTLKGGTKKSLQKFTVPPKDAKVVIAFRAKEGRKEARTRSTIVTGKQGERDFSVKDTANWTDEILAAELGLSTKVRRAYGARDRAMTSVADKVDDKGPHALSGKEVLLESAFGVIFPSCKDRTVAPELLAEETFADEALFLVLAPKAVGPGESWKPRPGDAKAWVASWLSAAPESTDLKCVLKEVTKIDGEKVAKIEVSGSLTLKDGTMEGKGTCKATIEIGLASGIVRAEKVHGEMSAKDPAKALELSMTVDTEATSKAEAPPK